MFSLLYQQVGLDGRKTQGVLARRVQGSHGADERVMYGESTAPGVSLHGEYSADA